MTVDYARSLANPAPSGLAGFAMTTPLLHIHNAGRCGLSVIIMGMGTCYGSPAQSITGIVEWWRATIFGAVPFVARGFFWLSLICIWIPPLLGPPSTDPSSMGWHLVFLGLFTFILSSGTRKDIIGKLVPVCWWCFFVCSRPRILPTVSPFTPFPATRASCAALSSCTKRPPFMISKKHGRQILPL